MRKTNSREAGSAYILVLLVLVVLTILGLSLSFMTQTELQIGSNERVITRVFYAADSSLDASLSTMVSAYRDYGPRTYVLKEPGTVPGLDFKSVVDVSALVPVSIDPCNLCEINKGQYQRFTQVVTAVATRYAGSDTKPLAQKTLTEMFSVEPWPAQENVEAVKWINDPVQLAKVKF